MVRPVRVLRIHSICQQLTRVFIMKLTRPLPQQQLLVHQEILGVDQWRSDYVEEVKEVTNYVNQNAIEETKERMSQRNKSVHNVDREYDKKKIDTVTGTTASSKELDVKQNAEGDGVIK